MRDVSFRRQMVPEQDEIRVKAFIGPNQFVKV